ncbi:hypothetical protein HNE_2522 [Hyphomonas neptunium ATCC 15444]|uniref:Uncharacterized protein n=2 Tax=Hyphomonas TaxID=85 RepID=Q0BZ77_HYPNA|nr:MULTISPECIES: GspMb/PilO family protein [Hyphomonas]ABI78711.1 hypothetical protein HNE_2522 [Hyphomonas neptunium ATCC 15444]KCZ95305.1 hypothetical protein HHI_06529 [Hyphomonas hirschiana VP5]
MIGRLQPLFGRVGGWLVLAGLVATVWLLLSPRVSHVLLQWDRFNGAELLALSHAEKLGRPAPPDIYAGYKAFIVPVGPDADRARLAGLIQSAVIERVRASQARLVDLRETGASVAIEGLSAIAWHLEVEGDIEAVLEVMRSLEDLPQPVLIDSLDLQTAGSAGEPDRNMRMTLKLTLWTGNPE